MTPILTATVGTNADLFPSALALYSKPGDRILDMTWGLGVFWRNVQQADYDLVRNDIDPGRGDVHHDFRKTPFGEEFDAVVFDPPYASRSTNKNGAIGGRYNNSEHGLATVKDMLDFYYAGICEAQRILKPAGILYLKCMDEVASGKQERNHIAIWKSALGAGFTDEDLFVLVQNGTPTMRHPYQIHARKNNSFLWVFRRADATV